MGERRGQNGYQDGHRHRSGIRHRTGNGQGPESGGLPRLRHEPQTRAGAGRGRHDAGLRRDRRRLRRGPGATVHGETGRIDLLVNNAGFGISGAAEESSVAQAQALFDVNLFGVIRTTRAVLPLMRAQAGGRLVNISSILGLVPAPYMAVYSASKHALEGYSESLDHEVRGQGIRVVLVQPAYTRTAFDATWSPPMPR